MPVYVDVAAGQIQTYLARSPTLRHRRGASAALARFTSPAGLSTLATELSAVTGEPVTVNPEAGAVDGVVSLLTPDLALAEQVADHVLRRMRSDLPALSLTASWAQASFYSAAYPQLREPARRSLPAVYDFPPLRPCDACGLDATASTAGAGLCRDCGMRESHMDRLGRAGDDPPSADDLGETAESRLLARLRTDRDVRGARDFGSLAGLCHDEDDRNHIATLFADGNGLGALFERAARADRGGRVRALSHAVKDTTFEALVTAAQAVRDGAGTSPVIPHVLGGDDLLVTVPADRAWRFYRSFTAAFQQLSQPVLVPLAAELGVPYPSVSAGLVICHASWPFSRQVTVTAELLRTAKSFVHGLEASVCWLEVTGEGEAPVRGRPGWAAAELEERAPHLSDIASWPAARRQAAVRVLDVADVGLAEQRLRGFVERGEGSVDALLGVPGAVASPYERVRLMREALTLVRWWRQ